MSEADTGVTVVAARGIFESHCMVLQSILQCPMIVRIPSPPHLHGHSDELLVIVASALPELQPASWPLVRTAGRVSGGHGVAVRDVEAEPSARQLNEGAVVHRPLLLLEAIVAQPQVHLAAVRGVCGSTCDEGGNSLSPASMQNLPSAVWVVRMGPGCPSVKIQPRVWSGVRLYALYC